MRVGIQLPIINTHQGAVWGDEVMAVGLARALSDQQEVSFAEVYDPVTLHNNLDVMLHLYPFPVLRHIRGPRHFWWYQAGVYPQILEDPDWGRHLSLYEGFFAASPTLKGHLMEWGVPAEKIALMPMSCDLDVYAPRARDPRYAHDVVFCGNGGIRPKGVIQRYLLPLKELGLKIFGSQWEEHPELLGCVEGPLPPTEVPVLYSSCKVVVSAHTTWHATNNLPTSRLWEALGCEAVVVSDRVPFAESLFGDTVVWTEGFQDIREKVAHLLGCEGTRANIRGKGRRIIQDRLSFQAYAPKLVEIFRTGRMQELITLKGRDDTMLKSGGAGGATRREVQQECGSSSDWNRRGEEAFAAGNMDEAERCFEKALQIDPFQAKPHSNLSVIYWQAGKAEDALNRLSRALELDPDDQDVILNCSSIFQTLGRIEDAREILNAYLSKKPWDTEVRAQLEAFDKTPETGPSFNAADFLNEQGELQFERGKPDHARLCFEMALDNDPSHAGAHGNLGVVYWQQGDLRNALEHFRRALDLNSEDPEILRNSSQALLAAGEIDAAADILRYYLQQHPQDEAAWEQYGSLLQQMGASSWKPDGLDSDVAGVYLQMGKKLARSQDIMGAAEALQRALMLDPNLGEAYYRLGRLHLGLDQKSEALDILREGLRIDPSYKKSVIAAGEILVRQEKTDEAMAVYKAALAVHDDEDIRSAMKQLE